MTTPEPIQTTEQTATKDLTLNQMEAEAITPNVMRDEVHDLASLLTFTAAVIPEGLRQQSISDDIINGFSVMLSDAENRANRLKEMLRK